jgi:hypothetical protein
MAALSVGRAISFGEVKHRQHPAMAGKAGDGADARCSVAAPLPLDCGQPVNNSQDGAGLGAVASLAEVRDLEGVGGSMVWFGSSAGVALSNIYPEAKSVGLWLRYA